MSEDEKGFLSRWSQRKRDAARVEQKPAVPDKPAEPDTPAPRAAPAPPPTAGEAELPFDLESLPTLEEITARTDMTVFFRKGVPDSIRNAALRKSWAVDPAIRDYVSPALDYAYDWNTPGGVPGSGELAAGTDIAKMVSQVMGGGEPQTSKTALEKTTAAETDRRDQSSDHAAKHQADAVEPASSVRLSEALSPANELGGDPAPLETPPAESRATQDEPEARLRTFASQQEERRHGAARPK